MSRTRCSKVAADPLRFHAAASSNFLRLSNFFTREYYEIAHLEPLNNDNVSD